MKHPKNDPFSSATRRAVAVGLVAAAVQLGAATNAPAGAANSVPTTPALPNQPPVTTAPAAPAPALSAEQVAELLRRLSQLEAREAARTAAEKAAESEQVQRLQSRIVGLEAKVQALESGRVLPEISVSAEDGPTPKQLSEKVAGLERKTEAAEALAAQRAASAPRVTLGNRGLSVQSADTNFTFEVHGLVQTDANLFFNDNELNQGNDGFTLRRVRSTFRGTIYRDFEYEVNPQYGGFGAQSVQILDAHVGYRVNENFSLKAGKFKGPVGLEVIQSIKQLPFSERSLVSNLVPLRSVGAQVSGQFANETLSFAAGVFNNTGDGRNPGNVDFTDDKEFAGRVFLHPFKPTSLKWLHGFGFGAGGSYSQVSSNAAGLPATIGQPDPGFYTSPGTQQFFAYNPLAGPVVADGAHLRLSPQAYFYYGPFGLLGEYALSRQNVYNSTTFRAAELSHRAWQITAEWVLTGEAASFNGVSPKHPFSFRDGGGWGAWQVVGRFSQLDIDDDAFLGFANPALSATGATSWGVGINWWLNRNARVLTSFSYTTFDGGGSPPNLAAPGTLTAPNTVTSQDEAVFSTRFQISF
jgi:phosphate-selective porin OprO/OprP